MNQALDNLLCQRYPKLLKDRHSNPMTSCLSRGFECGDGWFVILDIACALITADSPEAYATQIKEKFGSLRFYLSQASELSYGVVWLAEAMSQKVCEDCSHPGRLVNDGGWYRTVCATHAKHSTGFDDEDAVVIAPTLFNVDMQSLPMGPAWQRLVSLLLQVLAHDINVNEMPAIVFEGIEGEGRQLNFRWQGGDDKARGMILFVSALSARMHPETGALIHGIAV